ncbi:MAG: hypothetical protein ABJB66_02145 [Gemmatimonadaceae bacterium]
MRTYVITTGIIFALLVVAHVARMVVESRELMTDPAYLSITLFSAAMSLWAFRLATRKTPN